MGIIEVDGDRVESMKVENIKTIKETIALTVEHLAKSQYKMEVGRFSQALNELLYAIDKCKSVVAVFGEDGIMEEDCNGN